MAKTNVINIRVTEQQKKAICRLCRATGKSITSIVLEGVSKYGAVYLTRAERDILEERGVNNEQR